MPGNRTNGASPEGLSLNRILPTRTGDWRLLAWSRDGQWFAALHRDSILEIWHAETWTLQQEYKAPLSTIVCATWSPNAKMLALAGRDGVVIWNRELDETYHCFKKEETTPEVSSISWSPEGRMLACGANDKAVWLFDVEMQKFGQPLVGHSKAICSVAWAPIGKKFLASSADDGTIRLWNMKKIGEQAPLICPGHADAVCALIWTDDGEMLASASLDRTVRLWNKAGEQKGVLEGLSDTPHTISFLNDPIYGQILIVKVSDGTFLFWRTESPEARATLHEPHANGHCSASAFHPQLPVLVTADEDNTRLCVWDMNLRPLFENASSRQSVLYRNAKAIIIGNSGTGKSSLNLALTEEKPVLSEIPPDKHHIRLLDRQEKQHDDGHREVYEAFLWDMDGRSGYRLVHQLYLHDVAVVLIVLDTRSEANSILDVRKWVRAVQRTKSQRSLAIKQFLVITRAERGESGIPRDTLQDLQEKLGFDGVFVTSAREGWGISNLKKAILEAIDWEKLPQISSTAFIQEIREYLINKREAGQQFCYEDELYDAFQNIRARTANLQIGDPRAQFEKCIGRVEAQGLIRRLSFDNSVLLQPELFDTYASALLDAARNDPEGFGSIAEDRAKQGIFYISELVRIQDTRSERILLYSVVSDFLSYEIAFRERDDGPEQQIRLIFPSQTTQDNLDLPDSEQKHCIFHFEGDITNLYSTLVVRLAHSKIFVKEGLWRNAVTYTSTLGGICGVSLYALDDRHGELTVFFDTEVSQETRSVFTEYVYMHLQSRAEKTRRKSVLRCRRCETGFTEAQENRARERRKHTLTCPVCGEIVPLVSGEKPFSFSASVLQIDRNADIQLRTEEVKRRKEIDDYSVFFCCNDEETDKREIRMICDELEKNGIVPWFEERDLRPGKSRLSQIEHQLRKVKAAVICFGSDNKSSPERQMYALLNEAFEHECTVIPVLLRTAPNNVKPEPPVFLKDTRWIDFHEWNPDPVKQLIWGITGSQP